MERLPESDPRHAFATMDAMRALAAATVAISHIRDLTIADYNAGGSAAMRLFYFMTGFGHAGVIVFFVLSGFWITKSVVRRTTRVEPFWPAFLIDRVSRLWLVLIPVLVIGGLLDWYGANVLHAPLYNGRSGAMSLGSPITLSVPVFLANVVFLQTLLAPVFGSNGPLWSLAFEFWYYLWFPALWLTWRRRRPSWMLLSLLVAVFEPMLLFGFLSWMCGALLYAIVEWAKRRSIPRGWGHSVLAAGLLATGCVLIVVRAWHLWWLDPVLALAFAILLLGLCLVDGRVRGLRPLTAYGARASFSLYALHYPLAALAAATILPAGRLLPGGMAVKLVAMVLAAIVVLAWPFAQLTEAHTARVRETLIRRLLRRRSNPGAPTSFAQRDMTERLDEAT